ncbi:nitroreductase family protein [Pseudonocardia sp. GCM10023141]|uniref:nitroreductase family protein n=1 Tax=Pseudonocardia sp. GCM10023141 TaxID=3252653 RepID=UPI00360942DF
MGRAGHIAGAAAAIALVVPTPEDVRNRVIDAFDLGQATFAIMLAATDLGIGTGHSAVGDQDRARAALGVPDTHEAAFRSTRSSTAVTGEPHVGAVSPDVRRS